ncbi:MAG: aldo/keto reductase [Chloroflexi bacterium]|nr:aldo/keto reductase [Chloroflexota bacterium]MCI0574738.1 aldo/keto reductase [Chloroflexota bacterium]MCI0645693.1 aldo/keto reductase [Chloroflexota bacterium]MCI0726891.1 aldo/keto reductase [Chloroflexota bacterium]
MIYQTLGKTGLRVSKMGFGCAPLGNEYGQIGDDEAIRAVQVAIDEGINFFDTSPYYGRTLSEVRLGKALAGRRDKVILATKGGRFDAPLESGFDFSYDGIMRMCEASLKRLQTEVIDVYQLHDIEFGDKAQVVNEAIPAIQKLKAEGKVRFIGVTGFPLPLLREMVETQALDVTLSYSHYNLINQTLNGGLVPAVKARGLGLINASVTNMGLLTDQGPQPWHPAPARAKTVAAQAAAYCRERGASIAQLAIQFALQNPQVDVTLLGTRTEAELQQSLPLLEREPDPELLAAVLAILAPVANVTWPSGRAEYFEEGGGGDKVKKKGGRGLAGLTD